MNDINAKRKASRTTRRRIVDASLRIAVALGPLMSMIALMSDGGHWH